MAPSSFSTSASVSQVWEKRATELNNFFKNIGNNTPSGGPSAKVLLDNSHRVSEKLAARMLDQIGLDKDHISKPFKLFDNACGIGSTAFELHRRMISPEVMKGSSLLMGDFSEGVLDLTRRVAEQERWGDGLAEMRVEVVDGQNTGLPSGEFTHVTTNIGFQVIPDSKAALDEAIRILQPGGHLAFTTWERVPGWALEVQSAFQSFPFEAPFSFSVQTTSYGDWGNANWIRHELEHRLKLEDVKVDVMAFLSRVDGVDYFLEYFGGMVDWIVKSNWSEELQGKYGREEVRELLRRYLEGKYGDAGWDVSWVAIVASGRVPS